MNAIEINDLNKTYHNGYRALTDVNLTVPQGDFFALLGANGAGKSTTIGIITSLIKKSSGSIKIFGQEMATHLFQTKLAIGLVPQEINFNIFERCDEILITQAGYYGVPFALAKSRAEHYLKKLDLWEKRRVAVKELSGGMKRRLMIARALMHHPKLLMLDEPTAGVDIEIRRSMWEFLRHINQQGTTIVLTTHYLEEAEYLCRNMAIIDKGKIIANTSVKNLLAKLQYQTFILDLSQPLTQLPTLNVIEASLLDANTLEIKVDNTRTLNDLFEHLSQNHIRVRSLRNKTNRLEELFLDMINRHEK